MKTQEIITELMVSLNMDAGGELSKNLLALYMYFNSELMNASLTPDRDKLTFISQSLDDLREAWNVAATQASAPQTVRPTLDLRG
jgi:flagellar protein FliS